MDFLSLLPVLAMLMETTQGQPESTFPGGRGDWQLFSRLYSHIWQTKNTVQQRFYLSLPLSQYLASWVYSPSRFPPKGSDRRRVSAGSLAMKSNASGRKAKQAPSLAASRTSSAHVLKFCCLSGVDVTWHTATRGNSQEEEEIAMGLGL